MKPELGKGALGTVSSKFKNKSIPELRAMQSKPGSLKDKMDIKHAIASKLNKIKKEETSADAAKAVNGPTARSS
ncbi:hypothetical protein ACI3PL_20920, partial [Lacticaseibacillus paracasei]